MRPRSGLDARTDVEALVALEEWLQDQRRLADVHTESNLDVGKLEQLLDGATIEDLEAQAHTRRLAAPARPEKVDADRLVELENARQAKADADGNVQESQRAVRDLLMMAKPIATAFEREARVSRDLEDVKTLDRCLVLAETYLQVAKERAHADIAPALADTMRPWIAQVTSGRYVDIKVEPDSLKLLALTSRAEATKPTSFPMARQSSCSCSCEMRSRYTSRSPTRLFR